MSIRMCVIGCGWIVQSNHGPALRVLAQRGEVELAACCDLDAAAARKVQQEFGFGRIDTDLDAMLDRERPDAVLVAVPPEVACAIGKRVLSRGLPTLLEKPPADTLEGLDSMIALAKEKQVIHQVAFNRRFAPILVELRRRLASAGPVHCLQAWMMRSNRRDPDFSTTAIHLIDAVRFVLNDEYRSLNLRYQTWSSAGSPVTNFSIEGVMASGAMLQICICPDCGMQAEGFLARCAGRTFEAEMTPIGHVFQNYGLLREWSQTKPTEMISGKDLAGRDEPFVTYGMLGQMASFLRSVKEHSKPAMDLQCARRSLELMLALRARAATFGQALSLRAE
jgi:myo-inositol 2-dehydrogenase / D-chiro-inositol 1-dehydrogenase